MLFTQTQIEGAFIIDIEKRQDSRGFFARTFCAKEFLAHGLKLPATQCNLSFSHRKGTLRGLHYQIAPATETKLIRCIRGAIYDVLIDMRPESPTYLSSVGIELSAENHRALYVPEMIAHGYQALTDGAEALYQTGAFYTLGYERGIRYDDPTFAIKWPIQVSEISNKDAAWPLFESVLVGAEL